MTETGVLIERETPLFGPLRRCTRVIEWYRGPELVAIIPVRRGLSLSRRRTSSVVIERYSHRCAGVSTLGLVEGTLS